VIKTGIQAEEFHHEERREHEGVQSEYLGGKRILIMAIIKCPDQNVWEKES
jgi:hypothetical protein